MVSGTIDPPGSTGSTRRWSLGQVLGSIGAVVGIIAGGIAVLDYVQKRPSYDLTGEWHLTNTIESTTFRPFQGLRLGYRLFVRQHGLEFEGSGEKWSENDAEIPSLQHTPITLTGAIDGQRVKATFRERGARRETVGTFEWTLDSAARTMNGRFTSTAANTSGPSKLERVTR